MQSQISSSRWEFLRALAGMSMSMLPIIAFGVHCMLVFWALITVNVVYLTFTVLQIFHQVVFVKKNDAFINFIKSFKMHKYFTSATFEQEESSLSESHSMICAHPHGIYSVGLLMNLNTYIHMPVLGSRFLLNTPLIGLFTKWWGIQSVDNNHFKELCEEGKNFAIIPGGFEEATITSKEFDRVYLKNRKGFIKYALQYSYKLYPMYTFNENQLFETLGDNFLSLRLYLNKFKLVTSVFFSKYFLIFPNPYTQLHTVVGKGIQLPKIENPTSEDVEKYHDLYIQELKGLFNRHKAKYNITNDLIIF